MDPSYDGSNILILTKFFVFDVYFAGWEEEEKD